MVEREDGGRRVAAGEKKKSMWLFICQVPPTPNSDPGPGKGGRCRQGGLFLARHAQVQLRYLQGFRGPAQAATVPEST